METLIQSPIWDRYGDEVVHGLLNLTWAAIILVVGLWIAGAAARFARNSAGKVQHIEPTLVVFFGSIVRYAIIAVVIVAVLQRFGVQTASIVAVLGAATLAIGLALQGALSNVAAGVLLILYRPYRIGDYVELVNNKSGTVRDVNIFTTELCTPDNVKIVVLNGQIFAAAIANYSANDTRRALLEFHVGYGADLNLVQQEVETLLKTDARVQNAPAPAVSVARYADPNIVMQAEAWCETRHVVRLRQDMSMRIHARLRALEVPFA